MYNRFNSCTLLLVTLVISAGCKEKQQTHPEKEESRELAATIVHPGLFVDSYIWSVSKNDIDASSKVRVINPTKEQLSELFEKIDWKNPDARPTIGIIRLRGDIGTSILVRRYRDEEGLLQIQWLGRIDGKRVNAENPALESTDHVLEALIGFLEDRDISDVIKWSNYKVHEN